MLDCKKALTIFILHLCVSSFSWEVSGEHTPASSDAFRAITEASESLSNTAGYIQNNGTVMLYGNQANQLALEARAEVAEQAANVPMEKGMVSFVQRGPAITEVGPSQRIGEVVPENYPSFVAAGDGTAAQEELLNTGPMDRVKNIQVGNLERVLDAVKPIGQGLPLPTATVTGSKDGLKPTVQVNPDQPGTALGVGSESSSFGEMGADKSFQNLLASGKNKESLESKLQKDLAGLNKNKDKDEKKNTKSPEELKADIDKIKKLVPAYDFKDYEKVRDLIDENPGIKQSPDMDFVLKADEIFAEHGNRDQGEDSKSKKEGYQQFLEESLSKKKNPLFPGKTVEPSNRIRDDINHKD